VEGPTDDPQVLTLRAQQQRNLLATLLLSQGVPMLLHGDELGRSQRGNNNGYCQDNAITWIDWSPGSVDEGLIEFVERVVRLRQDHPVFRRRRFFQGEDVRGRQGNDITWFRPDGQVMDDDDWNNGFARSLGMLLNGDQLPEVDTRGEKVVDDSFLLLLNAHDATVDFSMPQGQADSWHVEIDTQIGPGTAPGGDPDQTVPGGGSYAVAGRCLALLRRER
jgi:glycogen operon protein